MDQLCKKKRALCWSIILLVSGPNLTEYQLSLNLKLRMKKDNFGGLVSIWTTFLRQENVGRCNNEKDSVPIIFEQMIKEKLFFL